MKTSKNKNRYLISFFVIVSFFASSCHFFNTIEEDVKGKSYDEEITSVKFNMTTMNLAVKESEYLKLSLNPSTNQGKCSVRWDYDSAMIDVKTDNFGAIITPTKSGTTYIKASCNGIVATCLLSIQANGEEKVENPYIISNYSVVELQPNNTMTISSSLYGGNIEDMEDFTWEIKDSSIAEISWSRNNCIITSKKPGSTQIVCHHPKAEYDYSFVVYVYTDKLTETFITTEYNVLSINKNDEPSKTLSVDLVNPLNAAYKNGFRWNYADEKSKEIISINSNLNTAEIMPLKNGIANIVVTHENSEYDLNIIVRVTTIVKNVYIGVSTSSLVVDGSDAPYVIHANLENYDNYVNPDSFVWTVPEEAHSLAEVTASGNSLRIQGKKNGTFKVNVSHELSEYSRNILVVLQNQIGSAIDASMYITTDQNFIQTKVGNEPSTVFVRLIGGIEGEDNIGDETSNFSWYIKGGRNNEIVEVQQVTGVIKDLNSRAVSRSAITSGNSCEGKLVINPLKAGEATIVVTHPRCLYDTEIQVKVYAEGVLVNPKTITTEESMIRLLNGQSKEITAILRNVSNGEENSVSWQSADTSSVTVSPATGRTTIVKAVGSGSHQTYVTASLEGALADKKILILSADTEEELNSMKGIFADSTYVRISVDESKEVSVESFGLDSSDRISWTSSNSSVCIVSANSKSLNSSSASITAIGEGKASVTAKVGNAEPVVFDVTVLKKGESSEILDESAGYLTTNQNAVVIESVDSSTDLQVSGVNISSSNMQLYTNWTPVDEGIFDIYGTPGSSVKLTATKPGKTNIKVTNKFSSNSLTINAKCGELYEWKDDYIVYITSENDVVNIINGESTTIGCSLVNTTQKGQFYWNVTQGADNIEITGLASGTCNIKGIQAGQAIITVSNSLAGEITKEILVNIANTEEELKGFKYLTTSQNVVTVGEKSNVSVSVEIKNADGNILTGYSWRSTNSSIVNVVGSGNIAVIYGLKEGTAKVIVENYDNCSYPLEFIVNVVDPIAAANDPYISCNNIVTCTVGGDAANIVAELIGGNANDVTGFQWKIVDSGIATLRASNDSAQIKAVSEGVTQVIVSHPKASVSRSILIICEPKVSTNCYITITEHIIKMSPSDDSKTITATLVNGKPDDVYDFKWWADSYDKINMNYTGASCLIEPISAGTVTIHVSHPKAALKQDIVLYISNYTDFAFSQNYVELTTGSSDYFVNMEVPATGVDCVVSYRSEDSSLVSVFGNNTVCTLHPGNVPTGFTSKSCKVYATLQTKGGAKQAEAQLLVSVTKKDETKPYIALLENAPTIITMNKGEKKNISAKLFGNTVDTTSAGLKWSINQDGKHIIDFTSSKTYGSDVQIEAFNSGKTVITVTHDKENGVTINPLTIYVIVAGVDEPTVTLSAQELPIYIGEDTQNLVATVQNNTGEELEWTVTDKNGNILEQDYFNFTTNGNKAFIVANKPGTAWVKVKIPSNGSTASCKVEIREAEKIDFFVYDDESKPIEQREKRYITTFQVYPGEVKPIHYETVPVKDTIKNWYVSDNNYFDRNPLGYITSWKNPVDGKTYSYPEGVGTVVITGKTNEGTAILKATTQSLQEDSVSITNSYNYLFTLNKSIISATPKEIHDKPELLYVDYELRPGCSYLLITKNGDECAKHLTLENKGAVYNAAQNQWKISAHDLTPDSASSGIVKGRLLFKVDGEVNTTVTIKAFNSNVISSNGAQAAEQNFANQTVKIQVFYEKHTFTPVITKQVPYINRGQYPATEKYSNYSRYDAATNTIFLGDGEHLEGTVSVNTSSEPYSNVNITRVYFEGKDNSTIKDQISGGVTQKTHVFGDDVNNQTATQNTHTFKLSHNKDYGIYSYHNGSSLVDVTDGMSNMYRLQIEGDKYTEVRNDTIKETSYVGNLVVEYTNYAKGSGVAKFNIPIYVVVRNNPCADDSSKYKAIYN